MATRTILYTGRGGAGTSSVAAATARRCAADGQRTLVISPDLAFAAVLGTGIGAEPVELCPGLWAQRACARAELERRWGAMRERLGGALTEGATPGALMLLRELDGLLGLLTLKDHHDSGRWDVVVVDCAPPAETLRLLSVPDAARWWLGRVVAPQGRVLDAVRPLALALLDLGLPGEAMLDEIAGLARNLVALGGILRDQRGCSVRLVVAAERTAPDAARRALSSLHLCGVGVDAVVVNRLVPPEAGAFFEARRAREQGRLHATEQGVAPVPVLRAPLFAEEVAGPAMLDRLAESLFPAGTSAAAVLHEQPPEELVLGRDGATLRLALPFAERDGLRLQRIGDDLVLAVDGHRRTLPLPPALADYRATGARFHDGSLVVAFAPPA